MQQDYRSSFCSGITMLKDYAGLLAFVMDTGAGKVCFVFRHQRRVLHVVFFVLLLVINSHAHGEVLARLTAADIVGLFALDQARLLVIRREDLLTNNFVALVVVTLVVPFHSANHASVGVVVDRDAGAFDCDLILSSVELPRGGFEEIVVLPILIVAR